MPSNIATQTVAQLSLRASATSVQLLSRSKADACDLKPPNTRSVRVACGHDCHCHMSNTSHITLASKPRSAKSTETFADVAPILTSRTYFHGSMVSSEVHTMPGPANEPESASMTCLVWLLAMVMRITASFVSKEVAKASFSLSAPLGHQLERNIATAITYRVRRAGRQAGTHAGTHARRQRAASQLTHGRESVHLIRAKM